jgi:hypothetical protein
VSKLWFICLCAILAFLGNHGDDKNAAAAAVKQESDNKL